MKLGVVIADNSDTRQLMCDTSPCSDHGSEGQDERAYYLGEGAQQYFGGCRAVRWHRLGEGYNRHYYILVPNIAGYIEPAQCVMVCDSVLYALGSCDLTVM